MPTIARQERVVFIAISAVILVNVVLRAALVPAIHDEARTFQQYILVGSFMPFHAHWDANNHVLQNALSWCAYELFGVSLIALRLPSVLAFILYAWSVWRIGMMAGSTVVRWCFLLTMLLVPFQLDFFSLARGYALALAFLCAALVALCAYIRSGGILRLVWILLALLLASFSSLSLITLWAMCLVVLMFAVAYRTSGRWKITAYSAIVLIGIVPLVYAMKYMMALNDRHLLYFGRADGIGAGSIGSLLLAMFGRDPRVIVWLVQVLVLAAAVVAWRAWRVKDRTPRALMLMLSTSLLFADALGRIALHMFAGTLYPEDRTALQWVPLFLVSVALALDRVVEEHPQVGWAAVMLLILPARTLITANISSTSYWASQAIPARIHYAAEERQQVSDRALVINGYHQMPACWAFGDLLRGDRLGPMCTSIFPDSLSDLMLIDPAFTPTPKNFHAIADGGTGHSLLLARDRPLRTTLLLDTSITFDAADEFHEVLRIDPPRHRGQALLLAFDGTMTTNGQPSRSLFVLEADDAQGAHIHYEALDLSMERERWTNDPLHLAASLSPLPERTGKCVAYFYDPEHAWYGITGRLRLYHLQP